VQQLREALPESCPYCYAIPDRDIKVGKNVTDLLASSGIKPKRISFRSPWQNGITECWIGSGRRNPSDHVTVINAAHSRRLMRKNISHYHVDRIHDSLEKHSPATRAVSNKANYSRNVIPLPRIGGLPHRYDWQQTA